MATSLDVLIYICAKANYKGVLHVDSKAWNDIVVCDAGFHTLSTFENIKRNARFCGMPIVADNSVLYAEVRP